MNYPILTNFVLLFGTHTFHVFTYIHGTALVQQPTHIENVTPVKIKESKALENKENMDPNDDAARPDPPNKTPPGKIPTESPIKTNHLFEEAMVWNVYEDYSSSLPDIAWNFPEPATTTTTTTGAAGTGTGLSVSFPDFAAFLRGMEKNASVNLGEALNTTGFNSSFFAYPEDKSIVPVKLDAEQDVSKQQQDKSAVELIEEEKSADVSEQQDKSADVDSSKDGKPNEESIEEKNRADDSNLEDKSAVDSNLIKPDALDQLVAAATATEKAIVAVATDISLDSKTPEKTKQTPFESPDFNMQAKRKNVPALTPVSEANSNSYSESDEEVTGRGDSPSSLISFREESYSSNSCMNESDEERSNLFSTDAVNEDDLVDEAYNSMNVSILSLSEIFQDDLATEISELTQALGTANAEAATEEVGLTYSLSTSHESAVSKSSSQHARSIFGDWVAEVMSIEVSLEAGKFTLRKMDGPGEDTCVAQQGHFMTRTEYMPRLAVQDKLALVEGPQDELEADKEASDFYVKAQWNEFLPATLFSTNCHQGAVFSMTDFTDLCSGKNWEIGC
jgi:hypothetical protein